MLSTYCSPVISAIFLILAFFLISKISFQFNIKQNSCQPLLQYYHLSKDLNKTPCIVYRQLLIVYPVLFLLSVTSICCRYATCFIFATNYQEKSPLPEIKKERDFFSNSGWNRKSKRRWEDKYIDKLILMIEEMGIPFAYDHFAEDESPGPSTRRTWPVSYTHLDVYKRQS